ncbi:GNAT family N-acetyltransferase [Pyruvatibacter sp.]|uniref:GNAT family N-acetyltransferase n=1 Tax=Pyruvatibacter sp. TaxID=1981328 RepID=UPI0032EB939E
MTNTIRAYVDADLDAVMAAWESAVLVGHPFLSEAFKGSERYNIPNVYLPNTETWVCEQDGKVVGFIAMMVGEDTTEVGAIFVHSQSHGTGAGRMLMDKARALYGTLELEVFKENKVGRRFYAAYGFVPMSERFHEASGHMMLRLRYPAS